MIFQHRPLKNPGQDICLLQWCHAVPVFYPALPGMAAEPDDLSLSLLGDRV